MHVWIITFMWLAGPQGDTACAGITMLDANDDGTVTLAGDAEPLIACLFYGQCPPDAACRVDCNGDEVVSIAGDGPCLVDCVFNGNCPAHCPPDLPTIWLVQRDPAECALDLGLSPGDFSDYDTALCELQAGVESLACVNEQGQAIAASAGVCAEGTLLYTAFATQLGGVRHFFDAETGAFLALRSDPTDATNECPEGLHWPEDLEVVECTETLSLCAE